MTPDAVTAIIKEAVVTLLLVSAPGMLVALVVGVGIALLQALTSIQEVTLTFVPKIILVFAVLLLTAPFMAGRLQQFTEDTFARMAQPVPVVETEGGG